jgi:hypothetical protein
MVAPTFDRDGLDYIYYGAIAAAVSALFTFIAFVAGGSVAGAVIGVLGGLALLAAGGLWVIGFGKYRAYYRSTMGYGAPTQPQYLGPSPPPPPPPPPSQSHKGV